MHSFTYNDIKANPFSPSTEWTIIPETQGSDYSGSSVTRSNFEYIRDNFNASDDLAVVYGWFYGYAIAYRTSAYHDETMDETIRETIDSLTDYPVICDDTLYRVETRWVQDALSDWTIPDFKRAVERLTENDDIWDDVHESTIQLIWDECQLRSGEDWIFEHCSAWIDVDRIASVFHSVISDIQDIRAAFKA